MAGSTSMIATPTSAMRNRWREDHHRATNRISRPTKAPRESVMTTPQMMVTAAAQKIRRTNRLLVPSRAHSRANATVMLRNNPVSFSSPMNPPGPRPPCRMA